MKKNITILRMSLILLLGFFIVFSTNAQSTASKKLSIQGYLKDGNGKAVDNGNYAITFKIYDVAASGTALWTEDNPAVNVFGGIYTVQLGSITNISTLAWNKPYFLGVSISGTELSPRTELTYAPYAFAVNKSTYVQCSGAVGDVKYSILDPNQFAQVNGDCWVPMDGRSIAGSQLATLLGTSTVANAGGMFLRGQDFSNSDNDPFRSNFSSIATYQGSDNLSHTHTGTTNSTDALNVNLKFFSDIWTSTGAPVPSNGHPDGMEEARGNPDRYMLYESVSLKGNHSHPFTTLSTGSVESRPRNLNLWTYIRIN